jgi:flagellar basal-body rod modification protein FlgD
MSTTPVTAATTTAQTATDRSLSSMKSEDFFKILVTELRQQDPFEPAKTADMIGQVSQIRSIELSKNLTDALTQITSQQRTAGASDLLGKYVTATVTSTDGSAQDISGVVTGIRFDSDGSAVLELDTGQSVPATAVTRITSVQAGQQAAAGTTSAAASTAASSTASSTAADKTTDTAKEQSGGLLPWLSLDGGFHL